MALPQCPSTRSHFDILGWSWMNKLGQAWAYGALHVSLDAPFISGWWWSWSAIGICGAGLLGGKHLGKYPPRGDRWYSIFEVRDSTFKIFKPRQRRRQRYSLVCSPPVLRTHLLVAQEQIQELLRWLVDGICSFQLCLLIRHSKQHVSTMTNYDKLMVHIWKSNKHHFIRHGPILASSSRTLFKKADTHPRWYVPEETVRILRCRAVQTSPNRSKFYAFDPGDSEGFETQTSRPWFIMDIIWYNMI